MTLEDVGLYSQHIEDNWPSITLQFPVPPPSKRPRGRPALIRTDSETLADNSSSQWPSSPASASMPVGSAGGLQSKFNTPKSRSKNILEGKTRAIAEAAGDLIADYTLFENPLPDSQATLRLLDQSWSQAQVDLGMYGQRTREAESFVSPLSIMILIVGALTCRGRWKVFNPEHDHTSFMCVKKSYWRHMRLKA